MDKETYAIVQVILFIVRIIITIYCVNKAKSIGKSAGGWGVFAFFLPIIALISIQFVKPNILKQNE